MRNASIGDEEEIHYMKQKMYDNFKKGGLLDSLKAQLRSNLLEKLQKRDTAPRGKDEQGPVNPEESLRQRLMYSIIADFLKERGLNYTMAVFLPEITIGEDKLLDRSEMADIMLLREFASSAKNGAPSILDLILKRLEVFKTRLVERGDRGTQTMVDDFAFDIERKLDQIGQEYMSKQDQDVRFMARNYEEKLAKMKKEYEARMKAELNAEVTRIKEFELSAVRLEEAEKYRMKMEAYRMEIDQVYQEKLGKLKERERDTIEKCKTKMKDIETASYEHRQRILKDFDLLKLKEEEIAAKRQLDVESVRMHREKIEEKDNDLNARLRDLEEREKRYQTKLREEMDAFKYKLMNELDSEKLTLLTKNRSIEEDLKQIPRLRDQLEEYSRKNGKLMQENTKLLEENTEIRSKLKEFEKDNQQLRDNLRLVSNSSTRDQSVLGTYEMQIKALNEEMNILRRAMDENKKITEDRRAEHLDEKKRLQEEVKFYQSRIEKLENEMLTREKEIFNQKENMKNLDNSMTDMMLKKLKNEERSYGLNRVQDLDRELEELRRKRENEIEKGIAGDRGPSNYLATLKPLQYPTVNMAKPPSATLQAELNAYPLKDDYPEDQSISESKGSNGRYDAPLPQKDEIKPKEKLDEGDFLGKKLEYNPLKKPPPLPPEQSKKDVPLSSLKGSPHSRKKEAPFDMGPRHVSFDERTNTKFEKQEPTPIPKKETKPVSSSKMMINKVKHDVDLVESQE